MTDYCTSWPDRLPSWLGGADWSACCKIHDDFYSANADNLNWFDFIGAHWDLAQCVGGVMGATMFAGLSTFGFLFWVAIKSRAFGKGRG